MTEAKQLVGLVGTLMEALLEENLVAIGSVDGGAVGGSLPLVLIIPLAGTVTGTVCCM